MLAVKIVVSWVRLGFTQQFVLERISGAFLANLLHKARTPRSQMRLLRAFLQSDIENFQGLWRLYSLSGQHVLTGSFSLNLVWTLLVSAYTWLCLDDLLIGREGCRSVLLKSSLSPGWTGALLACATCSLPRFPGPFQQGCSPLVISGQITGKHIRKLQAGTALPDQ